MNSDVYTTGYTPDHLNQYTTIIGSTTVNPEHDLDGNLEVSGQWTYQWNTENQLVEAKIPGDKKLRFVYDGLGRRTSKEVREWDADSNAYLPISITVFTYDGWNMIAEVEYNSTFIIQNSTFYTWGLDLSGTMQGAGGVGGLLAVTQQNGSTYLPSYDFNGNIMGYFDTSTESPVAEFEYGPFGELIRETYAGSASPASAGMFRFRFSTKYEDAETGLLYYGYRYYQAETGRWLNRDPIEERGGLNLYGMVGNNPVNFADLLGLATVVFSAECDRLFQHLDIVENVIGRNFDKYADNPEFLERLSAQLERINRSNVTASNNVIGFVNSAAQLSRAINGLLKQRNVKDFIRTEYTPKGYIQLNRSSRAMMGKLNDLARKFKPLGRLTGGAAVVFDVVDYRSAARLGDERQQVQSGASLALAGASFIPGVAPMVLAGSVPIQIGINQANSGIDQFEDSIRRGMEFDANMLILKGLRKRDELLDEMGLMGCLKCYNE